MPNNRWLTVLALCVFCGCRPEERGPASADPPPPKKNLEAARKESARLYNQEGEKAFFKKDYSKAVKNFKRAARLQPKQPILYNNLGRGLYMLGEYEQALQVLFYAEKLAPKDAVTKANIGDVFRQKENYAEAIRYYHSAQELAPNMARVHYELGNLYLKRGQYPFAELRLKRTLKIDPKFHRARLALVITYHMTNRYILAWQEIQELEHSGIDIQPDLKRAVIKGRQAELKKRRFRPGY